MNIQRFCLTILISSTLMAASTSCYRANNEDPASIRSREIISPYSAVFEHPPQQTPSFKIVDGPITGNGDIGLTLSGPPERQRYWISKNDFWKSGPNFKQAGPSLIGGIDVSIKELVDASYHVEQNLYESVISSEFSSGDNTVNMNARVLATENLIVINLQVNNNPVSVDLNLWAKDGYGSITEKGQEGEIMWVTRKFNTGDLLYPTEAIIAMRILEKGDKSFILKPGRTATIIASVNTNHESIGYQNDSREKISKINHHTLKRLEKLHNNWWQDFWAKSFVEIEDNLLQKYYYSSLYIMASCSRNVNFPPGLYGNWITMDRTAWSGDYHLDYNHEAPFWALFSSNRVELTDPYDTPMLEHIDIFKENACKYLNKKGAYASVAIGPKGLVLKFLDKAASDSTWEKSRSKIYEPVYGEPMFLGMKSNAVFASMNMILRYRYTFDNEYANKVYPYLISVADFWEDYLVYENGRYVIYDDSHSEVGPWQGEGWEEGYGDFNPVNSLGFLRVFFDAMIEISQNLERDSDRHEKWNHILNHLSDFPVYSENGKSQFRPVEGGKGQNLNKKGIDWIMMHGLIFPATNFGLSSDPEKLNMIHRGIDKWDDGPWLNSGNSIQSVLIGCTRVGYDPNILMKKAKEKIEKYAYPNLWIFAQGGGIESCSAIPGMINEMMLQSHENVIYIFPVFPDDQKASFYRLRTFGAFLVSSAIDKGNIEYVNIESEKGRDCNIMNPWPDMQVKIFRNGKETGLMRGKELLITTDVGDQLVLVPEDVEIDDVHLY